MSRRLFSWPGIVCTDHLGAFTDSGSPRLAGKAALGPILVWPASGFPHLAIYAVEAEQVVVLRVLHAARDIPATLRE
jgi:toxin ParE1/3/4